MIAGDLAALSVGSVILIFLALGIGSFAKGVTGIGLPLVAVPLLANFIGVERTVVVMVLPSIVSNGWLMLANIRHAPPFRQLALFLGFGLAGGFAGTWLLAVASPRALTIMLAVWLAGYLYFLLTRPDFRLKHPQLWGPPFGLAAGLVQGATGVSAPLVAPYLSGIGLNKLAFVFSVTLAFTLFSFAQTAAMVEFGLLNQARLIEGALALIPVVLFLPLGIRLSHKISQKTFERILIGIFLLMEARLIYQGVWGG